MSVQLSTLRTLAQYASRDDVRQGCRDALYALETRYSDLRRERADIVAVMAHEGNGDRPTLDHAPSSISAGEVRVTKRPSVRRSDEFIAANGARIATSEPSWYETDKDARYSSGTTKYFRDSFDTDCISYRAPLWLTEAVIDRTLPSSVLDSFRKNGHVIEAPTVERKAKAKPKQTDRAKERASLLRSIAGTIRMAEQD